MKMPNYLLDRNGKPVDADTARRRRASANNKGFVFRWYMDPPKSPLFQQITPKKP